MADVHPSSIFPQGAGSGLDADRLQGRTLAEVIALARTGGKVVVSWEDITGKPTTFPPSYHTHQARQVIVTNQRQTLDEVVSDIASRPVASATSAEVDYSGVYAVIDHNHDDVYALIDHDHDEVYAVVGHDHDTQYALINHDHNGVYATVDHNHDASYAAIDHDHDEDYAPLSHNHDTSYAAIDHDHDGDYAPLSHNHDGVYATVSHDHSGVYAPAAEGVTNGNSHDHSGGDGGTISHTSLSNIGTNTHSQIDTFISSKAAANGLASLDASTKVVQDPANATATPTASKIPIADGTGKLDSWISDASTTVKGKVELATDGESAAGLAVQANDSRLSNQRDPDISGMTAVSSPANSDAYPHYNAAASANRKITWANILAAIKTAVGLNDSDRYTYGIEWGNPSSGYGIGVQGTGTSGSALSAGNVVYLKSSDSRWYLTDADDTSTSCGVLLGISLSSAGSSGQSINVLLFGKYTSSSWSWTTGGALYLSQTSGALTQTCPTGSGVGVVVVGYALSSTTIFFFQPGAWIVRA